MCLQQMTASLNFCFVFPKILAKYLIISVYGVLDSYSASCRAAVHWYLGRKYKTGLIRLKAQQSFSQLLVLKLKSGIQESKGSGCWTLNYGWPELWEMIKWLVALISIVYSADTFWFSIFFIQPLRVSVITIALHSKNSQHWATFFKP